MHSINSNVFIQLFLIVNYLHSFVHGFSSRKYTRKPKLSTRGYNISGLVGLSEKEIDENAAELLNVIKYHGPEALLILNHSEYHQKGFVQDFESNMDTIERNNTCIQRWRDLIDFFEYEGGMDHFKPFWWPHYSRQYHTTTSTTPKDYPANIWDIEDYVKRFMPTTLPPEHYVDQFLKDSAFHKNVEKKWKSSHV